MDPNTSSSSVAWTSPAAMVLEHGEPSMCAPSLLSPAFSPASSPGLVNESGSRSRSSWYGQIPPSPAMAMGNGSLSVHVHATSSQPLPLSFFHAADKLPMVGYDLFANPEATAATPLPALLGGQWEQGESSSMAASVLPECPSPSLFGFAGESAACPSEVMPPSFSPSSAAGGGLLPQSSDHLVGFVQLSSDSELEPLRQSLRTHSLAVEESPVDACAPLLPIEEEEIDVSAFLVSDPEDQLANASWTTSPQMEMGGGGSGASASWMAPGSNDRPPTMLAPAPASTCTMLSTNSGSLPCHSIGAMMKPSSSSQAQGAGASSSNYSGFVQPSSSSVLAPLAPNLQGPLLPVKQEVMEYVNATARRHPDFISLVDEDDVGLYEDAIPCSIPSLNRWARSSSGQSQGPSFVPAAETESSYGSPSFALDSWGSSSSFAACTPCFDQSTSIDVYSSSSTPTTFSLPPLPRSSQRAGRPSASNATRIVFTDAEIAIIRKEKNLQELLRNNPKKVKRILYNRAYSAMAKVRKVMHMKELERLVVTLEMQRKSLCAELQSLEEGSAELRAKKMEMQMMIGELEQQTMLKDAVREALKAEIQKLKHLKLN